MNDNNKLRVLIEGPACSGKSTVAQLLKNVLSGYGAEVRNYYRTLKNSNK